LIGKVCFSFTVFVPFQSTILDYNALCPVLQILSAENPENSQIILDFDLVLP